MPTEKIKTVPDPIFNDFLYTVMFNMSSAEKRNLHGKYLRAVMSEKAAKSFIKTATDEDKKIVLAAAGYKFFWTFIKSTFKQESLREILDAFEKDNKVSALNQIAHQGVFVTDDKAFTRLLGLMSAAIHQPSFYFDLSLLRTGFHIKKWNKRSFNAADMEARDLDESATMLAKTLLAGSISMNYVKGSIGLNSCEMQILLYLYTQPHMFISEKHLTYYFHGYIRGAEIRLAIRNLWKSNNIEQDKGIEKRYTITGSGTRCVSNFFKTVFTKINQ